MFVYLINVLLTQTRARTQTHLGPGLTEHLALEDAQVEEGDLGSVERLELHLEHPSRFVSSSSHEFCTLELSAV